MDVKKRESTFSDEKKVGLSEFEVVEFNKPFDSEGKEIKYLGEKDGNTTFRIAVTLKSKTDGKHYPLSFYLENKEVVTKDGTKKQYINPKGQTTYAVDPDGLTEKFAAGGYHVARVGEADLAEFLNSWLDVNRSVPYDILPDWKEFMKGSAKELINLLKADKDNNLTRPILAMVTVRTVEKDDKLTDYQQVYNRRFLPGFNMKYFRAKQYSEADLEALREKQSLAKDTKKYLESYERFAIDVTDPQYGIKDSYFLGPLKDFVPEEHQVAGDKVLAEDNSDY
jgi:hypothetical protein